MMITMTMSHVLDLPRSITSHLPSTSTSCQTLLSLMDTYHTLNLVKETNGIKLYVPKEFDHAQVGYVIL